MAAKGRINLSLSVEDASAVADALSYYNMASSNNFDMGYRGDPEARDEHRRTKKIESRLVRKLEGHDG